MGFIYRVINKIDGKCYVGQTKRSRQLRKSEHERGARLYYDGSPKFYNALRHHGFDNFEWVWFECDRADLDEMECKMIVCYDSMGDNGYNLTTGGNPGSKHAPDSESKLKAKPKEVKPKKGISNAREHKFEAWDNFANYPEIKLPAYIVQWRREDNILNHTYQYEGYAIVDHPHCSHKFFGKTDKSFHQNFEDAKTYLDMINDPNYVPIVKVKQILPEYIHERNDRKRTGYSVTLPGKKEKRFIKKKQTMEHKLQLAIAYKAANLDPSSTTK